MAWLDNSSGRMAGRLPVAVAWPLFGLLTLVTACSILDISETQAETVVEPGRHD